MPCNSAWYLIKPRKENMNRTHQTFSDGNSLCNFYFVIAYALSVRSDRINVKGNMQPPLPLPTAVRIAGCVSRHLLWHSWQKNLCLPDRQASIVRLSCGTSRLHRAQRNVAGGFLAKIDEKIDLITMVLNSSPNTTAASVSLLSIAILEYNSEAKLYVMVDAFVLLRYQLVPRYIRHSPSPS